MNENFVYMLSMLLFGSLIVLCIFALALVAMVLGRGFQFWGRGDGWSGGIRTENGEDGALSSKERGAS